MPVFARVHFKQGLNRVEPVYGQGVSDQEALKAGLMVSFYIDLSGLRKDIIDLIQAFVNIIDLLL